MTKRKSKRHNPEQIVRKLRGETVAGTVFALDRGAPWHGRSCLPGVP